jgi:TolB-like protein
MSDELWILVTMAGMIALLAMVALVMFAPPRPSVPADGPIRIAVKPFEDIEPDPEQIYLGDSLARGFAQSLERYARFEGSVGDGPARFHLTGKVRKKGTRLAVQTQVTSDGRLFWSHAFDVKEDDRATATAKAVDALAHRMKVSLKNAASA